MKRSAISVSFIACSLAASTPLAWSQASTAKPPVTTAAPAPAMTPQAPSSDAGQLKARGPDAVTQQDPSRIVATIAGKSITAKQAQEMLNALRPEDRKRYESNLSVLVQQIYMEDEIATEAMKLKLDQQAPWKEQLRISRANILTQAYLSQASTSSSGPSEDPKAYYDAHAADYDQIKLSGILIAFNPPGTPATTSAIQRTEGAALEKANEIAKKIKAGGDFSALARTDSDSQQSSVRGGDLGTFVMADPNLPPNVRDLVAKMQPGQVSEPFRVPGGFYLFRLETRTRLPLDQVRPTILQKQQNDRTQAVLKQQMDKYKIQVLDPDFFNASSAPAPASKVPSLARPAGAQPPPAKP